MVIEVGTCFFFFWSNEQARHKVLNDQFSKLNNRIRISIRYELFDFYEVLLRSWMKELKKNGKVQQCVNGISKCKQTAGWEEKKWFWRVWSSNFDKFIDSLSYDPICVKFKWFQVRIDLWKLQCNSNKF